jgi:hypothetical protein
MTYKECTTTKILGELRESVTLGRGEEVSKRDRKGLDEGLL